MKRNMVTLFAVMAIVGLSTLAFGEHLTLMGAGATFPGPLYSKMFDVYSKEKKVDVNYQAIGSGGGIQQLISKTVDFGASDAPMNEKETKAAKGDVLHIPTCLGAVVLTYNLPGNPALKFTPDIIADIFLGKITKWNDERIAKINPEAKLDGTPIIVVHRSDGSGTTYTFSEYLSSVSPDWKSKVGTGKSLNWPTGLGGKGNPGVAGYVKQTPGAIGYVEIAYAKQNKMPFGTIQNKSGNFIEPNLKSVAAAANVTLPEDTKVSLVNTEAKDGYPISTFTWLLIYKEQAYGGRPKNRADEMVKLLTWVTHEGQQYNETLDYGVLPANAVTIVEKLIRSITYEGKKVSK
jgi:phosphate transport system substrate-binding protein